MSNKRQFNYNIGDRIAERPKAHGIFAVRSEVQARIAQYRTQRYGTILNIKEKKNSAGVKTKVIVVQWDHLKSPTEHAQMRICPIDYLDQLTKQVIVPGE